jgi:hypothetical protein
LKRITNENSETPRTRKLNNLQFNTNENLTILGSAHAIVTIGQLGEVIT